MIEILEPISSYLNKEPFNEKYRNIYEEGKKIVIFKIEYISIHNSLDYRLCLFPGTPVEFWKIPFNKWVSTPKYLANLVERWSKRNDSKFEYLNEVIPS